MNPFNPLELILEDKPVDAETLLDAQVMEEATIGFSKFMSQNNEESVTETESNLNEEENNGK